MFKLRFIGDILPQSFVFFKSKRNGGTEHQDQQYTPGNSFFFMIPSQVYLLYRAKETR